MRGEGPKLGKEFTASTTKIPGKKWPSLPFRERIFVRAVAASGKFFFFQAPKSRRSGGSLSHVKNCQKITVFFFCRAWNIFLLLLLGPGKYGELFVSALDKNMPYYRELRSSGRKKRRIHPSEKKIPASGLMPLLKDSPPGRCQNSKN